MGTPQIPFISAPFKRTEDIDWIYPLKRYIAQVYQDDPEKYNEETFTINRLRQDTRGAGKDITGRDLLYRYFGQLELLDLRFPVDEKHVKVVFTWYDAFSGRHTSQYSLAFEKASVIFNIAATLSAIAASQNRAEAEGRKRAFNFFQAAAGMFQYINDNFLHAPSLDLSRETVKMLGEFMLAQAHECFLENSLREKKKNSLIAKLASHAAWTYGSLIDHLHDAITRGVGIEKAWIQVSQTKQKYYQALAHLHKAEACKAESKYGEQVVRLAAAEGVAKEAAKLAGSLTSMLQSSNHANGTLPADSASALQELSKSVAASCGEKHTLAIRDNDMVYHDTVPQESILVPIDRLNIVIAMPITELYGANEVKKVIGSDIFLRLVPLSVHESASLYSEEKAQLVRAESEKCDLAKAELNASLDYMKLPGALDKFKRGTSAETANEVSRGLTGATSDVREWADIISFEESNESSISKLRETLDGLKDRAKKMLDDASLGLDQEMRECENMRTQFGDKWTQSPSGSLTNDFRKDIRNYRTTLEEGAQSDAQLLRCYEVLCQDIAILSQGSKSRELEAIFVESTSTLSQEPSDRDKSLLDLDTDTASQQKGLDSQVLRIEDIIEMLLKVETERKETLADLKEKTLQDDISHLLVLNKKTANVEQQIFTTELEKFQPHQQRIGQTLHKQQELIQELTAAFKQLMEGQDAQKLQSRWDIAEKKVRHVTERFYRASTGYHDVKEGLNKGIRFYITMNTSIESLLNSCRSFIQERGREKEGLGSSLASAQSAREQEVLKEKITKYTMEASTPKSADTSLSQLTDQTRHMSLGNTPYSPAYSNPAIPPYAPTQPHYMNTPSYTPSSTSQLHYTAPPTRPPTAPYAPYPGQDIPPSFPQQPSYQRTPPSVPVQTPPSMSSSGYPDTTPYPSSYSQPHLSRAFPYTSSPVAPVHSAGYSQTTPPGTYRGPVQPPTPGHPSPPPLSVSASHHPHHQGSTLAPSHTVSGYYHDPTRQPGQPGQQTLFGNGMQQPSQYESIYPVRPVVPQYGTHPIAPGWYPPPPPPQQQQQQQQAPPLSRQQNQQQQQQQQQQQPPLPPQHPYWYPADPKGASGPSENSRSLMD
ncbi:BRO1-like domain-containing protein [Spinellus fusiger]|nr:BRO1-like domain-containing protein [Spinellus fusiger]